MTSALARSAVVAVRHFYSIYSSQGVRGLVLRTKSMYIMLMQSVGGVCAAPQDLGPGVARSADGLPRVIPKDHRRRIRAGDRYILRIWLSWFSIYRVLVFPGQLKLSTISDPGVEFSRRFLFEMLRMIPLFGSNVLGYSSVGAAKRKLPPIRFFHVNRSTPVLASVKMRRKISTSPLAIIGGIYSLRFSEVWTSFRFLMDKIPSIQTGPHRADGPAGESWFVKIVNEILCPQYSGETTVLQSPPLEVSPIGALGQKLEAAGKIRVFAMVDCWTQWLLAPIHRFVFDLISAFPSDGTFDQLAPVERLIGLGKTKF